MLIAVTVTISILLDYLLGEPRRYHPLVGFGMLANKTEFFLNQSHKSRVAGIFAWLLVIVPFVLLCWFIEQQTEYELVFNVICLTITLGYKSLVQHARAVSDALRQHDIVRARQRIAMMVSRDVKKSNEKSITRATIESVLENGNDAIFAAMFWFCIAGAPGVVLYRLANTLDAMWGYKTEQYKQFGWAAARIDDFLNLIPARLTAISYSISGQTFLALRCWRQQACLWNGINPGVVMASGAGSLQVKLGGKAKYHGAYTERPVLGCGKEVVTGDIERAIRLIHKSVVLWIIVIIIINGFYHYG